MDPRASLRSLLLEKSVRTGKFTLASGKESDLYIDCRTTTLDPVGANLVGSLGWDAVRGRIAEQGLRVDAIGGMTMGADPISLAVGMTSARLQPAAALQVFTVRKEPKGHGRGKQMAEIRWQLEHFRGQGDHAAAEELRQRYLARMWDLSAFVKVLKQRFAQWYNRRNGRDGCLWSDRLKSVLVEW